MRQISMATIMKQDLTPGQLSYHKLLENRQWLSDNLDEIIAKYPDKWIAVWDKRVVQVGKSYDELMQVVEKTYPIKECEILMVPKSSQEITTPV